MVGLGLSLGTDGTGLSSNGKLPKMSKKWFFKHMVIYNAMNDFTEEELDKVKADCEAGKWSKKLPGKPLLWAFMSKMTRKTKYLQMFAVGVDVIKYRKTLLKSIEQHEKNLRDWIEQEGNEREEQC